MTRPYLRRRSRRVLAFTTVIGLGLLLTAIRHGSDGLWLPIVWGFEDLLAAEDFGSTLSALQFFLLSDLAPFLIAVLAMALITFAIALVFALIGVTILPLRFQPYLDGVVGIMGPVMILESLGFGAVAREHFGSIGAMVFYWFLLMSTSALAWRFLPFGFTYKGTATRTLPLAMNAIADRLIPGRDSTADLADIAIRKSIPMAGECAVDLRIAPDFPDTEMAFDLREEATGGFVSAQEMRYRLKKTTANETEITVEVVLEGVSPMTFWDFWSRPFAEDFADHITARLTHAPDRSLYGAIQSIARKKFDKKALKTAAA